MEDYSIAILELEIKSPKYTYSRSKIDSLPVVLEQPATGQFWVLLIGVAMAGLGRKISVVYDRA